MLLLFFSAIFSHLHYTFFKKFLKQIYQKGIDIFEKVVYNLIRTTEKAGDEFENKFKEDKRAKKSEKSYPKRYGATSWI